MELLEDKPDSEAEDDGLAHMKYGKDNQVKKTL